MSADPVAEVLADVARRNEINCTGPGEVGCRGRKGWHSWTEHRQHIAEEQAAALREAGLIPEATTRVEWGVRMRDMGGISPMYLASEAEVQRFARTKPSRAQVVRRLIRIYRHHVTEWEAVE